VPQKTQLPPLERMRSVLRGERPHDADRRERILSGAAQSFAKLGFRDARVEDVLAASDTSRGTFYRFFQSKEDVALALFELAITLLALNMSVAIAMGDHTTDRWQHAVDAFLALEIEHGKLVHGLLVEAGRVDSRIGEAHDKVIDRAVALLDAALGKRLLSDDPWLVRSVILGVQGLVERCHRQGRFDRRDAQRVRAIALSLLSSLDAGEGRSK